MAAPRGHVAAAKKAERRGEWAKALRAWKAAYAKDGNAEYLISIGDAWAHLGKTAEARKTYEGYLADPLALPSSIRKVNARLSQMAALPMALPLPAVAKASPSVVLPKATPVRAEAIAPVKAVPAPPLAPLPAPPPPMTKLAVAPVPPERQAPMAAVAPAPLEVAQPQGGSGRVQRTLAYASAVVAVVALGGGAFAYQQANSTHSELTSGIHSAADTQRMLENEQHYRTYSAIGLAGGLVLAGVATALFAF